MLISLGLVIAVLRDPTLLSLNFIGSLISVVSVLGFGFYWVQRWKAFICFILSMIVMISGCTDTQDKIFVLFFGFYMLALLIPSMVVKGIY
jgi:hypothetical protein